MSTINKKYKFGENLVSSQNLSKEDYIEKRLIRKINLYYDKSLNYNRKYRVILLGSLIIGSLIPIIINWNFLEQYGINDVIATILSILVVIMVSIEVTFNFREQFKNYKKAEDQLTSEMYLFQTNTDPYLHEDAELNFKLLVKRVESIIAKERLDTIVKITQKEANDKLNK